jgi:hypothetical protein
MEGQKRKPPVFDKRDQSGKRQPNNKAFVKYITLIEHGNFFILPIQQPNDSTSAKVC